MLVGLFWPGPPVLELPGLVDVESAGGVDVAGGELESGVVEEVPGDAGAIAPPVDPGFAKESDELPDDDPVVEPLPIEPEAGADEVESVDGDGAAALEEEVVPDDGVVLGLLLELFVDELDIASSVFGVSVLLQAPSAASVAARAIHLIGRFTFSPRLW